MSYYAIHIRTRNTRNGNPRRGWLVYDGRTLDLMAFVEQGNQGASALSNSIWADDGTLATLASLEVPVSEYNRAIKEGQEAEEYRAERWSKWHRARLS